MAKERMKSRELSLLSVHEGSGDARKKIFTDHMDSTATDSTASPARSYAHSLVSVISPTNSSMSKVGSSIEGEVSTRMLSLTIGNEPNTSIDSFNSSPDNNFNRGASAFMELIEQAIAKLAADTEALKIESLIVDMLKVDIRGKVPTPEHIPSV